MSWNRYKENYLELPSVGFSMDISRVKFPEDFFASMSGKMSTAYSDMNALEGGSIANPDENRMVGHYWLRNSSLAPSLELKGDIDSACLLYTTDAADDS